jgi:hypothetical protein
MLYFGTNDNALFAGTEQEGPMQGTETLFVVGEVNVSLIDDYIEAHEHQTGRRVGQVYLGAGFLSRCSPAYVRHVAAFVEMGFGDALMLTVEASYLDVKVLRECPRIDHWVYTAMMLGSVNPNYQQTMQVLTNKTLQECLELTPELLEKVSVKTDFAGTTMVVAAKDVAWSKYQDYNDTLLWTSVTAIKGQKFPMPMLQELSADPRKQEVLDLTKMDPKAPSYEVTVGWSPKLIFRSNP